MKTLLRILLCVSCALPWPVSAHASFQRELERYNRDQSLKVLEELDRSIELRMEPEKEEKEDEEGEGEGKEAAPEDLAYRTSSGWRFQRSMSIGAARESNYFQRTNNPDPEVIYTYIPSFGAAKSFYPWRYKANYTPTYFQHQHYQHNDRVTHFFTQSVVRKGAKLDVIAQNDTNYTAFPTEDSDLELSTMDRNDFSAQLNYRPSPKIGLSLTYANSIADFRRTSEKTNNVLSNTFSSGVTYQWTPKTALFANYAYSISRPPKLDDDSDVDSHAFLAGIAGPIGRKIAYDVGIGLDNKIFPNSDDETGLIFQGGLRYLHSPKTSASLLFQRVVVPTGSVDQSGDPLNHVLNMEIRHTLNPRLWLKASESFRLIEDGTISTVIDKDESGVVHMDKEKSRFYTTSLALSWRMLKNVTVSLAYKYDKVRSELKTQDRIAHTATAEAVAQF